MAFEKNYLQQRRFYVPLHAYIQICIVEYHWSPEDYIQRKYHELNLRPRKCLGYKTPYEVYFSKVLHLAGQFAGKQVVLV